MSFFSSSSRDVAPASGPVPRHIAVIMDGNGRWAKKRFLPRVAGHVKGVDALRDLVRSCQDRGVEYLTVFAFSSENWRRPQDEVSALMQLFIKVLENEIERLKRRKVRLHVVGDLSRFDPALRSLITKAETETVDSPTLHLTIAANYGGRWDIMQAARRLAQAQPERAAEWQEDDLTPYLALNYAPEPDLFIRTGGETRISNFVLWQLAYSELYFTDTLWPDFDRAALDTAIASYQTRERRFGRTSEQVSGVTGASGSHA